MKAALIRALHSKAGAAARWGATVRPDDATLLRRIAEEFDIAGGFGWTGLHVEYRGGSNPYIEISTDAGCVRLAGGQLLSAVRDALDLGRPGELF